MRKERPRVASVGSTDRLGASVYNDASSINSGSAGANRKSLASVEAFKNLFASVENEGPDYDGEPDEEFDVDLSSWGLDTFISKEKNVKPKGKQRLAPGVISDRAKGKQRARTMSLGDIDTLLSPKGDLDDNNRRNPTHNRSLSAYSMNDSTLLRPLDFVLPSSGSNKDSIPFPSSFTESSGVNRTEHAHGRAKSIDMSFQPINTDTENPFAIQPPSPSRSSRFDPKASLHNRTLLNATAFSTFTANVPLTVTGAEPAAERTRRLSRASFATNGMMGDDNQSFMANDAMGDSKRLYSRLELMRPKILVMPGPLQGNDIPPPELKSRSGFLVSTDGPPLPPGARASRPLSALQPSSVPVVANPFIPNPRVSLSSSQLLFRNSLVVGGQRDVTFNDIDGNISRAEVDGEQVEFKKEILDNNGGDNAEVNEDEGKPRRLAGKLYGRSLMDDLEERKANLHNKRRYGDLYLAFLKT